MGLNTLNAVIAEDNLYVGSSKDSNTGKFQNDKSIEEFSLSKLFRIIRRSLFEKDDSTTPDFKIPVENLTLSAIEQIPNDETFIIRLGHSTSLIKMANKFWLLDPVFSERASPFSFIGPKRFHQSPIEIEQLPEIEAVIISHNHYDHLDEKTIKQLEKKTARFILPVGNGAQLIAWGIPTSKITELDWWQNIAIADVTLTATPAQHFSGRGLNDRDKALWSSWVLKSESKAIFYSGDSGYFKGFKEIGQRLGPFDLTLMEAGAYDEDWPDVHMTPAQTAQAHKDLKGRKMLPVHNGTFDLAFHAWTAPFEELTELANKEWIDLLTPKMGQIVNLDNDESIEASRDLYWWRGE